MKKLNKKSDVYYVNKQVFFAPFSIAMVHLVDDDSNEFICTVKTDTKIMRGRYIKPSEIKIIDYIEYSQQEWNKISDIDFERAER